MPIDKGEETVSEMLERIAEEYNGVLYNNFCFEFCHGKSTEIDHILITSGGIFVIETKSVRGPVVGSISLSKWYWVGSKKKRFYFDSPLDQNAQHIGWLNALRTEKKLYMHNLVIFSFSKRLDIDSKDVYTVEDAEAFIRMISDYNRDGPYMKEVMWFDYVLERYGISLEDHIKNVQRYVTLNKRK